MQSIGLAGNAFAVAISPDGNLAWVITDQVVAAGEGPASVIDTSGCAAAPATCGSVSTTGAMTGVTPMNLVIVRVPGVSP